MKRSAILLTTVLLVGCGGETAGRPAPTVTPVASEAHGDDYPQGNHETIVGRSLSPRGWPLTVAEGTLRCTGARELIFQTVGGTDYGVNATARAHGYRTIGALRAGGASLAPLLDRAAELCATGSS